MDLLEILKTRFEENRHRHPELEWETVEGRLRDRPDCRMVLQRMEDTGGEPDVIGTDDDGKILFGDCSRETPTGRRSLCYDDEALRKRKKNPPSGSAVQQARKLQMLEEFDLKTSSWIRTPEDVRALGGALFCEKRYGVVFVFHNGADSYYSVRGWRGVLRV